MGMIKVCQGKQKIDIAGAGIKNRNIATLKMPKWPLTDYSPLCVQCAVFLFFGFILKYFFLDNFWMKETMAIGVGGVPPICRKKS